MVSEKILPHCESKIKHFIREGTPPKRRIDRFSAIIESLGNSDGYTQENPQSAYEGLVGSLRQFAAEAEEAIHGSWGSVSVAITSATRIRANKVHMALLERSLPTKAAAAQGFLDGLAAYDLASKALLEVRRRLRNLEPRLFTNKISISLVTCPNSESFQKLSLDELAKLVETGDQPPQIHTAAESSYLNISPRVYLKEHCEIQLVRFYIENPGTIPVMAYLGVSKLSCFLCSKFLEYLSDSDPGLPAPPIKFFVRGEHGKVYGRWCPPDIKVTGDMKNRVLSSLSRVTDDIRKRVRPSLERPPVRSPVGGEWPPWPSDRQLISMGFTPEVADRV